MGTRANNFCLQDMVQDVRAGILSSVGCLRRAFQTPDGSAMPIPEMKRILTSENGFGLSERDAEFVSNMIKI